MSLVETFIKYDLIKLDTLKYIYTTAIPLKHIYIDSFLSKSDLDSILSEWPSLQDTHWHTLNRMIEYGVGNKLEISSLELMGNKTQEIIKKLISDPFIKSLEYLTEIKNLKSDIELYGGGLVYTPKGGFLKVHADFNYYNKIKMYRRINIIIYLNEEWEESWNGNLEFWSEDMIKKQSYSPKLNTAIIFHVHDKAFHGYPDKINCPDTIGRKSINLYYYTEENDELQNKVPHKTIWKDTNNTSINLDKY
jgi:Rps23 Pro-64 3,4-dihydroxylase Tpa1-like proline 4-hydroxylase